MQVRWFDSNRVVRIHAISSLSLVLPSVIILMIFIPSHAPEWPGWQGRRALLSIPSNANREVSRYPSPDDVRYLFIVSLVWYHALKREE